MKAGVNIKPKPLESTQYWWTARSVVEKRLLIVTLVVVILFIVILTLYLTLPNNPRVCTSPTCVRTAMELLNHIDIKVDPCEDFYRFSCGNFLKNTKLDNRDIRSVDIVMVDEIDSQIRNMLEQPIQFKDPVAFNLAKKFYRACMNESAVEAEGLKRVKQIFRQIGGWPTLDGNNWSESHFDWKYAVHELRKTGINLPLFLDLNIEADKSDPPKYILTLSSPPCSGSSEIEVNMRNLYLDYMEELSILFGAERSFARRDMEDVLDFYLKLFKISEETEATNDTEIFLSLSELQYKYPSIHWFEFINNILRPATAITYDDVIKVSHPLYLKNVETLLNESKARVIGNSIAFSVAQRLLNLLPSELRDKAYEFYTKVNGFFPRTPRWSICISEVKERMSGVLAISYIQNYFDDDKRHKILKMAKEIKSQFKHTLDNLQWMDEHTKKTAIRRLTNSVEEIVPTESVLESRIEIEQNTMYDGVEVSENEFLKSALNLDFINTNFKFENLREKVKDNWLRQRGFLTGTDIIYSPRSNSLRFPIGVLQGVYFSKEHPSYMNYGALGSMIGHKISHIITGAEYGELGSDIRNWWTPQSLINYEEKLQCLENQYDAFIIAEVGKHVNGSNTKVENMAELAGKKVVYDTYMNWLEDNGPEDLLPGLKYSPKQLFWISSSIHHCSKYSVDMLERYVVNDYKSPSQFRVNGVLQNIPEFAYDFNCKPGSYMNPDNKCLVW